MIPLLLALCLVAATPARADDDSDQDRARRAVEAGEIRPLRDILAAAQTAYGGQFIEAELEHRGERWIYEIKLITGDGHLAKLHYDARDGTLLDARVKGGRHRR